VRPRAVTENFAHEYITSAGAGADFVVFSRVNKVKLINFVGFRFYQLSTPTEIMKVDNTDLPGSQKTFCVSTNTHLIKCNKWFHILPQQGFEKIILVACMTLNF
jgi:hypothetical protein